MKIGYCKGLKTGLLQLLRSFAMTIPLPVMARSVSDEAIQKNLITFHEEYNIGNYVSNFCFSNLFTSSGFALPAIAFIT